MSDHDVDVSGPNHLTSDSDSEVYCDSVDQFGQEEASKNRENTQSCVTMSTSVHVLLTFNACLIQSSEHNHSLDDTDEEENHILEPQTTQENQEGAQGPPHVIRCGGEDEEAGGPMCQRHKLNAGMRNSSSFRRGKGKVSLSVYTQRFECVCVDIHIIPNNFCVLGSRSAGHSSGALLPIHSGGDGDGSNWEGAMTPGESLNEQIVVVLARLQEDMQSVLERLHTLEALTTSQVRAVCPLTHCCHNELAGKGITDQ